MREQGEGVMVMVGRAGGPRGCVRASLARETTGALPPLCLPTPSPPHLSKLTPFLFLPFHALFLRPVVSLFLHRILSFFLYLDLCRSFETSERRSSPVPSLPSPIPATPFFPIHDVVRRRRGGRDSRFRSRGGCLILSTH